MLLLRLYLHDHDHHLGRLLCQLHEHYLFLGQLPCLSVSLLIALAGPLRSFSPRLVLRFVQEQAIPPVLSLPRLAEPVLGWANPPLEQARAFDYLVDCFIIGLLAAPE